MFVVTVYLTIDPEHVASFRETVLKHANNSLTKESGCRRFDVSFDPDDEQRVFIYEQYDDLAAFDVHTASDHFKWFGDTAGGWIATKQLDTWELASGSSSA
ncbi:putative quinol monooxygenase [Bythopirellula polymerisocia]|uniref:Autoinducer-2 (AI-2) modifying protein LsrG n=1 Tax=Bythopirellula polymerisocia TaxID=2528003 RepID=A0A5C6CMN1_9BACT|nr:putative quinol monooxygenase [Bythopirellula polymerisocia]TWU24724.1 autoinducer-2 (AI-2) modifying protein LsrG [Bythopirellula polymerisocia]